MLRLEDVVGRKFALVFHKAGVVHVVDENDKKVLTWTHQEVTDLMLRYELGMLLPVKMKKEKAPLVSETKGSQP